MRTQGWQVAVAIGLGLSGAIVTTNYAVAQTPLNPIEADTTLGSESSRIGSFSNLSIDVIDGGAKRGINLFHSFLRFNVAEGKGVYFFSPDAGIQNILARVTGNSRSEIQGTIGTYGNSIPNLFLINPNGIIFGRNASLDMGNLGLTPGGSGGSFVATTANAVLLGNNGIFSASDPARSNLLDVKPSALLFNAIAAQGIVNQSQATQSVLGYNINGLQVPNGRSLLLVGGDVKLEGGILTAPEGRIELGGAATSGEIGLSVDSNTLHLHFPDNLMRADILLTKGATINPVDVVGEGASVIQMQGEKITLTDNSQVSSSSLGSQAGGEIYVNAKRLFIQNGATISTITLSTGRGGDLTITASDSVELTGTSENGTRSGLFTFTGGAGDAGDLRISTGQLIVRDGARLASNTFAGSATKPNFGGSGSAGNLTIEARQLIVEGSQVSNATFGKGRAGNLIVKALDSVELIGTLANSDSASGLFASTNDGAEGSGGSLFIQTRSLSARNGAQVVTSTHGSGNAGNLTIRASKVELSGTSVDGKVSSGLYTDTAEGFVGSAGALDIEAEQLNLRDRAIVSSGTLGAGTGGDVTIKVRKLSVFSGAKILTGTFAQGQGGNLSVYASDFIQIDGASADGQLFSGLLTGTGGTGTGGNIEISTQQLSVGNGAEISASSRGQGRAGNIFAVISSTFQANNGSITTDADQSTGGNINITAKDIRLIGNSDIKTNVFSGIGNGGDITLTAQSIIALNDSDILAFARDGQGGNITLNTRAFFGQNYRPAPLGTDPATLDGNGRVDINASGRVSGIVSLPDVSFLQNGLTEFPQTFTDTTQLLANSCIVRSSKQNGRFVITGSGGLPLRPGDAPISPFPTGEVRGVRKEERGRREEGREETYVIQNSASGTQQVPDRPWKIGDPIVEPQGIYRLPNGELILSRECEQ